MEIGREQRWVLSVATAVLVALAVTGRAASGQVAEPVIMREFAGVTGFWSVAPLSPTWAPPVLNEVVTSCEQEGACLRTLHPFAGGLAPLLQFPIEGLYVSAATRLGDLDGDEKRDWLLRTPSRHEYGSCAGSLRVITRADPLLQALSDQEPTQFREHDRVGCRGAIAALSDVDGDGVSDYAAGDAECVRVWSGASGEQLWSSPGDRDGDPGSATWVSAIVELPDLTGDGVCDIAIARSWFIAVERSELDEAPALELRDGRTGQRVRILAARQAVSPLTTALARIDDLDGDGFPDLALGLSRERRVLFVSTSSGVVLGEVAAPLGSARFGASVLLTADYDGDGVGELLVGAPNGGHASRDEPAHLYLVSPARGEVVFSLRGRREADFMALYANMGAALGHWEDVDGDGRPEPCVSEGQYEGLSMEQHSMLLLSSSAIAKDPRFKQLPD